MTSQQSFIDPHHLSDTKYLVSRIAQRRTPKKNNNLRVNSIDVSLTSNSMTAINGYNINKYLTSSRGKALQNYVTQAADNKHHKSMSSIRENGKQHKQDRKFDDVDSLDISDMLKTVSHQKKVLTVNRWKLMEQIHNNRQLTQDDYKYFMMISSQANYRKLEYPGYYNNLLVESKKYPQVFFSCISKDIPRTMPDDHPLQNCLRNVLYAYAVRNPSLLYCQGMNYLVGFLLINKFSQEETFWLLVQLIEDIVMPDYFKDLATISLSVEVFENVVAEVFPELYSEMRQVGMESGIFLVGWYICLFTKGFINSVSQYLLQQIVLESYNYPIGFTLMKMSLGIFATLFTREQRFQFQSKDFKSLKESIESNVYQISLEDLKHGMNYFQFNYEAYKELTQVYTKKRQKIFAKAMEKQLKEKKLSLPSCSLQSPVCIHRVQIQKKIGSVQEILILKNNSPIMQQYIENYFPSKVSKAPQKISYESPKQCPITHHTHICQLPQHNKGMTNKKFEQQQSDYFPIMEGECSVEISSRFSKIEDRFSQFSQFFVVGDEKSEEVEMLEQKEVGSNGNNLINLVGNTLKRALQGIKLFRNGLKENSSSITNKISENSP